MEDSNIIEQNIDPSKTRKIGLIDFKVASVILGVVVSVLSVFGACFAGIFALISILNLKIIPQDSYILKLDYVKDITINYVHKNEFNDLKLENTRLKEIIEESNKQISSEIARQIKKLEDNKQNLFTRRFELSTLSSPIFFEAGNEVLTPEIKDIDLQIDLINDKIRNLSFPN